MKKKRTADKTKIPDAIRQLLGPPPILSTEDQHLYYATIETLAKDVNPDDIVTWFLIKDLGDYRTEIARYRRFKVSWLKKKYQQEISDVIEKLHSGQPERLTVITQIKDGRIAQLREQYRDDPLELELGEKEILERYEQDIDLSEHLLEIAVEGFRNRPPDERDFAEALTSRSTSEQIDQALATAEQNFLSTLRELERHIFGFGKKLRERLQNLEAEVLGGKGSENSAPSIVPGPVAENVE